MSVAHQRIPVSLSVKPFDDHGHSKYIVKVGIQCFSANEMAFCMDLFLVSAWGTLINIIFSAAGAQDEPTAGVRPKEDCY